MELFLHHAGRYDYAQTGSQITQGCFLTLTVSGLVQKCISDPEGNVYLCSGNASLNLVPPGFKCDFIYNSRRENYVLICDIPDLKYDPSEELLLLEQNSRPPLRLKRKLSLDQDKLVTLRRTFERIVHLKRSSLPGNIFLAEQLCAAVLGELALLDESEHSGTSLSEKLAVNLKILLDQDEHFSGSLQEHCRQLGYSPEHARRCFYRKYHIDPREYRLRRRMECLLQLMERNSMSFKEMAAELGMKNVTHLHSFVRQRFGVTPGELLSKLPG